MKIELRLKQVLQEYKLYRYGVEQKIANACEAHRHTIGKLLRNEAKNPSLEVLGNVCQWLKKNGVPEEKLPGILFGSRAPQLWKAIGKSKSIAVYLGMYEHHREGKHPVPSHMSIARHDASVESKIIHFLSSKAEMGNSSPVVHTQHVRFQFRHGSQGVAGKRFEEDKERAGRLFEMMRERKPSRNAILLGSQRANYMVEFFVADLFKCKPFKPAEEQIIVPFYLCYRDFDWKVPSCFGGRNNPPGRNGEIKRGTYYLNKNNEWKLIEWKDTEQDGGIVIIIRDASSNSIEMAVFGFSGRATNALGNELIHNAENFWPDISEDEGLPKKEKKGTSNTGNRQHNGTGEKNSRSTVVKDGKEIGVYICSVKFGENESEPETWAEKDYEGDKVEVIPLDKAVLEEYLNRGALLNQTRLAVQNET